MYPNFFPQYLPVLIFMSRSLGAARSMIKAAAPKVAALAPAVVAMPAFASDAIQSTMPLSLEVTFAAYLAVLLGTFVPVTFLIVLYSQTEARKAGMKDGA